VSVEENKPNKEKEEPAVKPKLVQQIHEPVIELKINSRSVYWIGISEKFSDTVYMELLKNDIYVKTMTLENAADYTDTSNGTASFIYNLDMMLAEITNNAAITKMDIAHKIAKVIENIGSPRVLIHCSLIDKQLHKFFSEKKLVYIEKPLDHRLKPVQTILALNDAFHLNRNDIRRFIRLNIKPDYNFPVTLTYGFNNEKKICIARILDASLNGMRIKFSPEDLPNPPLLFKDIVSLKLSWDSLSIEFFKAMVTRVNTEDSWIGINFLMSNISFIRPRDARRYEKMIEAWIQDLINYILHRNE
jgi:hypothetical protein